MVVYFDPASGDTHLLNEFAAFLIQKIASEGRPLETNEVVELISSDIEAEDQITLPQTISDILGELTALDIIAHA